MLVREGYKKVSEVEIQEVRGIVGDRESLWGFGILQYFGG